MATESFPERNDKIIRNLRPRSRCCRPRHCRRCFCCHYCTLFTSCCSPRPPPVPAPRTLCTRRSAPSTPPCRAASAAWVEAAVRRAADDADDDAADGRAAACRAAASWRADPSHSRPSSRSAPARGRRPARSPPTCRCDSDRCPPSRR